MLSSKISILARLAVSYIHPISVAIAAVWLLGLPNLASSEPYAPDALPRLSEEPRSLHGLGCTSSGVMDWRVCIPENAPFCLVLSGPVSSIATRDGRVVTLSRGDVALIVVWHPSDASPLEFVFFVGYPLEVATTLTLDTEQFVLIRDSEAAFATVAFPASSQENDEIIAALQAGGTAVTRTTSTRGTELTDEFSILGFSEALSMVADQCA